MSLLHPPATTPSAEIPPTDIVRLLRERTYYPTVRGIIQAASIVAIVVGGIIPLVSMTVGGGRLGLGLLFGLLGSATYIAIALAARAILLLVVDMADAAVERRRRDLGL